MSDETPEQPVDDVDATEEADGDATVEAPRRSRLALGVSLTVAVVIAGFVGVLATREPRTDRSTDSPLIGKVAPEVAGKTIDGGTFDIDNQAGRWVIVNFFAEWCPECRIEHPQLDRFEQEHEAAGDAILVSVVYQDEPADVVEFFEKNGGDWPVVLDDSNIAIAYGVTGVPETFLIAPSGRVVDRLTGGVTQEGINERIAAWEAAAEEAGS